MPQRNFLIAGLYIGVLSGYVIAKTGTDKMAISVIRQAGEKLMTRNAELSLDVYEKRRGAIPGKVAGGSSS